MSESKTVQNEEGTNFRELLERFAAERDKRYMELFKTQKDMSDQRFSDQAIAISTAFAANEKAISAAFAANEKLVSAAFNANEKATTSALATAKEAVAKAELASDKRFESVNEFRGQLKDQAATFITRDEYAIQLRALADKLDNAASSFSSQLDRATAQLNATISSLTMSRATTEGKTTGRAELWAVIIGVVSVFLVAMAIYFKTAVP